MTGATYLDLLRLTAPEIVVALTALLVLVFDLGVMHRARLATRFHVTATVSIAGCAFAALVLAKWGVQGNLPTEMLVVTSLTQLMQQALLVLTVLVLLLGSSARFTTHVGEYCALILFATTAMMLLVSTQNLLVLFIAIEFLSLSLYVLTGFDKASAHAAEAALKYFLYGGMSAGILLFGTSLLYGISGSLALPEIAAAIGHDPGDALLKMAMVMVLAGFAFKVAAAPFHMWAPEVYRGAPTTSAALIASSSKVASFFAMFVVFGVGLRGAAGSPVWRSYSAGWAALIVVLAAVSMLWGNLAALAQTSMRRLLAYSAIAHAGYMLLALAVHSRQSFVALVYYVITYALATLGAFGVLCALESQQVDRIADFRGLARRAPGLTFCLAIFLLSLAGIPPLAGFFAKFYLFVAALNGSLRFGLLWLVLLALATSVISFYYYLKVLKQAYVLEPETGAETIQVPATTSFALWVAAVLVVALGCSPNLLLSRIFPAVDATFR